MATVRTQPVMKPRKGLESEERWTLTTDMKGGLGFQTIMHRVFSLPHRLAYYPPTKTFPPRATTETLQYVRIDGSALSRT